MLLLYLEFVQPICLPQQELQDADFQHTGDGIVAGWGLTNPSLAQGSDQLLFVSVPFVDINKCALLHSGLRQKHTQLCLGIGKGKDSCGGDSG